MTGRSWLLLFILAVSFTVSGGKVIRHSTGVSSTYIVVLRDTTPGPAVAGLVQSLAASYKLEIKAIWTEAFVGFLASAPDANFLSLSDDPRVQFIEQDAITHSGGPVPSEMYSTWTGLGQTGVYLWHIDRLDDLTPSQADSSYAMCSTGSSVIAYVIDTGVIKHKAFETSSGSRVIQQLNFVGQPGGQSETDPCVDMDSNYHGTAVASVLAGTKIGASRSQIVSLRVFDCTGASRTSDLISAVNWVAGRPPETLGVINFSGFIPIIDENFDALGLAVRNAVLNTGMPFFTSADNYATDACRFSPNQRGYNAVSRTSGEIMVVGGTMLSNNRDYRWQVSVGGVAQVGRAAGSNGGDCVGIYAPATDIYHAMNSLAAPAVYAFRTGTSFASPLAAGIAARYISRHNAYFGGKPTPTQVYQFLTSRAQPIVNGTTTPPTYRMCFKTTGFPAGKFHDVVLDPGVAACAEHYLGPYEFPQVSNTSNAGMLYWDETLEGNNYYWWCGDYITEPFVP